MNVLVTGGAGFIGSHVVDRLLNDGHRVTVVDLWESDEIKVHRDNPDFTFVKSDVLDDETMERCVAGKDRVIHMAAVLGTSETITTYDVEKTALTNVVGTVKMLKHCKAGIPFEVMGIMVGEFVDEYSIAVVDVFAMPQI